MSKTNRILLILSSSLLLASCGGGTPSSTSENTSAGTSTEASSQGKKEMGYEQAEGQYVFPQYTLFSEADKNALPALGEHEIVAFCPISTGHTNVYNWTKGAGGDTPFASWPGTKMTQKYNEKWYKVTYENYDDLWIIFNGNGQTADMHIDHAGYWWFWESDGDIHDDVPESYFIDTAKFVDGKTIRVVANDNITSFELYEGETKLLSGEPGYNAMDIYLGEHSVDVLKKYTVKAKVGDLNLTKSIAMYGLYGSDEFNEKYAYDGDDLGVTYASTGSIFKVWSPVTLLMPGHRQRLIS